MNRGEWGGCVGVGVGGWGGVGVGGGGGGGGGHDSFFIINGRKFDSHMKSNEMICFLYEVYWDTSKSGLDNWVSI